MKIAYLILAHKNPKLIKKMIEFLSNEDCAFFIHIDEKSNIKDFSLIKGKNIYFCDKRISVYWAEYSMVEAILILIQEAIDMPQGYEYYVLLSGSDYPLRGYEYLHKFFDRNQGVNFISLIEIPNKEAGIPVSRINTLRIPSNKPIYRFVMKTLAKIGLAKRDYREHLDTLKPYGGSTWWALTRDACEYILDFVNKNPMICRFFEKVFASDEMFFHTILGNSMFRHRIQRHLMYEDWSARGGHPVMINGKHVAFFQAHEKVSLDDAFGPGELLFARKVSDDNLEIVQKIDKMIELKDRQFGI